MIIKAQQKNLPTTPRKMQLVVNAVKHMPPTEAVKVLELYNKKSALLLAKTIKQAMANATNNLNLPESSLKIHQILMGRGVSMKRFLAGARGRGKPYQRVRTHLTVLLESTEPKPAVVAPKASKAEVAKKETPTPSRLRRTSKKVTKKTTKKDK